jgi:hypothetical protein
MIHALCFIEFKSLLLENIIFIKPKSVVTKNCMTVLHFLGIGNITGGFLRALRFPPPSKGSYSPNVLGKRDSLAAVLSPGRVAQISQVKKCDKNITKIQRQQQQKIQNTKNKSKLSLSSLVSPDPLRPSHPLSLTSKGRVSVYIQ